MVPWETKDGARRTPPTAIAVDQLLQVVAALDQRPDGLADLRTHCELAARMAASAGFRDIALVWVGLTQLADSVAEDRLGPDGGDPV